MSAITLSKHTRLKRKTAISELFDSGSSSKKFPLRVIYKTKNQDKPLAVKFAVSVPKKRIKLAVHRNRVKRKIREFYRLNKAPLELASQNNDIGINLMFVFIANDLAQIDQAERSMIELINHLIDVIQK